MKNFFLLLIVVSLLAVSCKKMKPEVLGPKPADDTTVVEPPYWCVKTAVIKRGVNEELRYRFEYNKQSLLQKVIEYRIERNISEPDSTFNLLKGDTISSSTITYTYQGDKLVRIQRNGDFPSLNYVKAFAYENDQLKTQEAQSEAGFSTISYTYTANEVRTVSKSKSVGSDIWTEFPVTSTRIYYPDSVVAVTKTPLPPQIYTTKEKWDKSRHEIRLESSYQTDTLFLTSIKNRFDPLIWEIFKAYYPHGFPSYPGFFTLSDIPVNPYFIQKERVNNYQTSYDYYTDEKNRVTKIVAKSPLRIIVGPRPYLSDNFVLVFTY